MAKTGITAALLNLALAAVGLAVDLPTGGPGPAAVSPEDPPTRVTLLGGGQSRGTDAPPAAEPLPTGTRTGPAGGQGSRGAGQVPAPPPPAPPEGPRTGDRAAQAPKPGAADTAAPQIQFDRDGLITMHSNELDVRRLLEIISRRGGLNILVSPKVSGTITANFEGVTLEQLLRSVLRLANLEEKRDGQVRLIYTREELQAENEAKKRERILTKVYKLNYIRADELMALIRPFLSEDVGQKRIQSTANYMFGINDAPVFGTAGGMTAGGSPGGGIAAGGGAGMGGGAGQPQRGIQPTTGGTSSANGDVLVIQDYESNLKIIDQIVERVDVQPVQVLIEAVIISVELQKVKELGVNFAVVDNLGQELGTIGSGAALNGNVGFTPASVLTAAGKIAAGTPPDPAGFTSATNGIKFGFVSNNVTGFIRALETVGSTKVLASPRILVLNKQRAEIQLGQRLGFRTLSQNFTSTIQNVQFLNTGTLLRLRPFVSSDGMVRMEIHPERSTGVVQDDLPSATTAELTTNVMVPDGATLVIGGLMEDEDDFQQQGLPGISRVPALGYLFGFKQKQDIRRELVVLLTPHIWPQDQAAGHEHVASARRGAGAVATPVALGAATGSSGRLTGTPERAHVHVTGAAPARPAEAPGAPVRPTAITRGRGVDPAVQRTGLRDASSAPSAGPGVPQTRRRHVVQAGEDFGTIARAYYGSAGYARALWWANRDRVAWPEALRAGTAITLPPAAELETLPPASRKRPDRIIAAPAAVQAPPPAPLPLSVREIEAKLAPSPRATSDPQVERAGGSDRAGGGYSVHVVRRDETLRGIARDRLGDARRGGEIAELNRDLLGDDPRPAPGQRLLLPADAGPPSAR
jgi:type IV pilus secretin PilQ/predicted competence protein